MVKRQIDPGTNEPLPPFGVINDEEKVYKKYETPDTIGNAMYLMKANSAINSNLYSYCKANLINGQLKFLEDERKARVSLLATKAGQNMDSGERAEYLKPFIQQSILKTQMLNLKENNEGTNIILKPLHAHISHDKFSALIYALFMAQEYERKGFKRKRFDISQMTLFTRH